MNERVDPKTGEIIMELPSNNLPAVPMSSAPMPAEPKAYPPKMAKAILAVTKAIGGIGKHGTNTFQHYNYQKWEDVLDKLSPLLVDHGLIVQQSELGCSISDKDALLSITYEFDIINEDGDVWPKHPRWKAIARLCDSKGVYDDKAANKCHTQAHKYFLLHFFKIKTKEAIEADEGEAAAPRHPPKPTVAPKPVPGAKPHVLPHDGMEMSHWVTLYIAYLSACPSKEALIQWDKLNDKYLTVISNKDKAAYEQIVQTTQRREKELVPPTKKPGPPPPPKAAQPTEDTDVALVTGGVTPPGEMVWEDPPADAPDGQAWLRDFSGALSGCTTPQELEEIRKTVGLPAKGKVSQEEWEQGGVLLQAAKNRIALEE